VLARAGAGTVLDLPVGDEIMQEGGMRVFAARVKEDRMPVDVADLVEHVAGRIPEYMIPASLQVVDALPLTSNGKVDQQALRSWLAEERPRATPRGPQRPPDPLEARLEALWAEVFGVAVESVGLETGFLDLGGDSLLAARLAGRLQEEVPEAGALYFDELLRAILEGPTVAELAATLASGAGDAAEAGAIPPVTVTHVAERAGPLWVLVHDGDGTLDSYRDLIPVLSARGPVAGLTVGDPEAYLGLDTDGLVERATTSWAGELLAGNHPSVHLVGRGPGCVLALDVARRLREAGTAVSSVTLIGPVPLPGRDQPLGAPAAPGSAAIARHTLRATAAYDPPLYAGDVTLVWLSGDLSGSPVPRDEVVAWWERLCLGVVTVVDAPAGGVDQLVAALPGGLAERPK
jgi:pyochelin synthetase